MRKKTETEVLGLLREFQKNVLENMPSVEKMNEEIIMMSFKVRPLQGDIGAIDLKNRRFIETLWRLGKLDEFLQKEAPRLNRQGKKIFFQYLDDIHSHLQERFNQLSLKPERIKDAPPVFEMEIFRDRSIRKKPN